jgi:F-type H+-transporting ATPase subunit alpha
LDETSKRQLDRGARLTELLRQPLANPMAMERQAVSIWAGTGGKLDEVPVDDVLRFEAEFHSYLANTTPILTTIAETLKIDDDTETALDAAIAAFKMTFRLSDGRLLGAAEADEVVDEDIDQAQIVAGKRA